MNMDKRFWKKVLYIGVPVALQNLINTFVNVIDTFMIGSLGEDYVSAVGLANRVFFVMSLLVFGIVSGSSVLLSQYFGKGDTKNLNRTYGFMNMLALGGASIFFILGVSVPSLLMRIFTNSPTLIEIGTPYLRIVSVSYLFTAFSMAASGLFRSINRTRAPMVFTFAGVIVNVIFNYLFIFGKLGFPELKANGAAIGTIIARFTEFAFMVIYLKITKNKYDLSIKEMLNINKEIVKKNLKFAVPVIINEFGWGLGTTMYSVIYGHMNDNVVAAMTIASALQDLVYALLFGVSTACSVIVGNELGANHLDEAKKSAKKLLITGIIVSAALSGILIALVKPYTSLYKTTEIVETYIFRVCIVYAILMPARTFNLINIVGILRSGGDTMFCMILELLSLWIYAIPMGSLGAFGLDLEITWVFLMLESEQLIKVIVGTIRFKQEKWVRNIVIN